jgi:hypothetical protein
VGDSAANYAGGLDANMVFFQNVNFVGYYAKAGTARGGDNSSYRGRFEYGADRLGLVLEHIAIGKQFDPEIGYVRRVDFRRSYADLRVSRRTRRNLFVRRTSLDASVDYIQNAQRTEVQNREQKALLTVEMHNTDQFKFDVRSDYELLPRNFRIAPRVIVPRAGYTYTSVNPSYQIGQHGLFAGTISGSFGSFYGGTKETVGLSSGYVTVSPHLAFEPGVSLNWVDLPFGTFTSRLVTSRTIITPTPRMLITTFTQLNTQARSLSTSVRLNWEYRPSSQLFVVYSDGRDTATTGVPDVVNRSFAVKITRLVRF